MSEYPTAEQFAADNFNIIRSADPETARKLFDCVIDYARQKGRFDGFMECKKALAKPEPKRPHLTVVK
jgi:hypothetical protein